MVAAAPPIVTVIPGAKLVPVIVIWELTAALAGIPLMVGLAGAVTVSRFDAADGVPPTVTMTAGVPAPTTGTITSNRVALTKVAGALTPPMVTVAPDTKFVPVIWTVSPGLAEVGENDEMEGVGTVTTSGSVEEFWPPTLTPTL